MAGDKECVDEIVQAALKLKTVQERNEFLDRSCADDAELRREVDRLLRLQQKTKVALSTENRVRKRDSAEMLDATRQPSRPPDSVTASGTVPRIFGDYELLEEIAQGGMGKVFKARQVSLNRTVALKMILAGQFACSEAVERFHIEAEAAGNLDHAGIVPVFDVGCEKGQHYFTMAFVEGQSLAERIEDGPVLPREAAMLTKKMAIAMQVAHDRGIVHRDLKPGNVLLDERGEPRITDFGLAKRVEGKAHLTSTGMVLGTPSYMPPEQAAGKEIQAAADVYSLGAILYAMLTGQSPFRGSSQLEVIMKVIQEEPIKPRQLNKNIPKDLEVICLKCLAKEPTSRYQSADELSQDLQRFLAREPIRAKKDWRRRFRAWTIREPVLAAHLAATLVMITIIWLNYQLLGKDAESFVAMQRNIGILVVWAAIMLVLQKVQNRLQTKLAIPLVWATVNPIFLTVILCVNDPPRGSLLSLYFLLPVTACFFRRPDLVVVTTIVSLFGVVTMVSLFFQSAELTHPSYLVVFGVNLAVTGSLLALLALRMKRLSEQDTL